MTIDVIVVGAGGFGREALDVVQAMVMQGPDNIRILGVVDDAPSEQNMSFLAERRIPMLGPLEALLAQPIAVQYLIGVGSPRVRESIAGRLDGAQRAPFTAIHPSATVGSQSRLGPGSIVCAGAQVSTNVTAGRHTHINPASVIGHDTELGDWVSVNPAAVISGDVRVGPGTLIGANATVLQGLTIGARAVIGAAACVVRDVPQNATVKGVPAR